MVNQLEVHKLLDRYVIIDPSLSEDYRYYRQSGYTSYDDWDSKLRAKLYRFKWMAIARAERVEEKSAARDREWTKIRARDNAKPIKVWRK